MHGMGYGRRPCCIGWAGLGWGLLRSKRAFGCCWTAGWRGMRLGDMYQKKDMLSAESNRVQFECLYLGGTCVFGLQMCEAYPDKEPTTQKQGSIWLPMRQSTVISPPECYKIRSNTCATFPSNAFPDESWRSNRQESMKERLEPRVTRACYRAKPHQTRHRPAYFANPWLGNSEAGKAFSPEFAELRSCAHDSQGEGHCDFPFAAYSFVQPITERRIDQCRRAGGQSKTRGRGKRDVPTRV